MHVDLTVDRRMAGHSGIGRYLHQVITIWRKRQLPFSECNSGGEIYSLTEQLNFKRLQEASHSFWVPHYNIPLLATGPLFSTVHDVAHIALPHIFKSRLARFYARVMLTAVAIRCRHVFFVSVFTRDEFKKHVGFLPRRSSIVFCGVDTAYWSGLKSAPSLEATPYFLAVGNVKPHKNLGGVLLAFQKIRESYPNVKLKIVGKLEGFRTGDMDFLETVRRDGSGIELLGPISDDALRAQYVGATALLFPSFYEGFGLPPLEAMAAGCPSVVSSTGALPEICGGGLGEFCDPSDPSSIGRAMEVFLKWTTIEKAQWRERSKARLGEFTWEKAADDIWRTIMLATGKTLEQT